MFSSASRMLVEQTKAAQLDDVIVRNELVNAFLARTTCRAKEEFAKDGWNQPEIEAAFYTASRINSFKAIAEGQLGSEAFPDAWRRLVMRFSRLDEEEMRFAEMERYITSCLANAKRDMARRKQRHRWVNIDDLAWGTISDRRASVLGQVMHNEWMDGRRGLG